MLQYGIIGNCKTCALVSKSAEIVWMCWPDFDSPSVFAKLLDDKKGGSMAVKPDKKCRIQQHYIENTTILETVFSCDDYEFKIIDFFPRYKKLLPVKTNTVFKRNCLVRILVPVRGKPRIQIDFNPRLNYARDETELIVEEKKITAKNSSLSLHSNFDLEKIAKREYVDLSQRKYMVFGEGSSFSLKYCMELLKWTTYYWKKWVSTLVLPHQNRALIIRSALTLKLLTYSETGAIIAAATTSLPEEIGSERCWDYRYCWVRDAAYCADAFKKIGRDHETKKLMEFIIGRVTKDDFVLPLYGIRGQTRIKESVLEHLSGFHGSRPVRIGNAAYQQSQHDIFGEIIQIMYFYFAYYEYEKKMTAKYWRGLTYLVNQIRFHWDRKDSSIWEFRGLQDHYTFSKFMCYTGVDLAIRLAQHFKKDKLANDWMDLREEIRTDILAKGYNKEKQAFTISYGSTHLDAALLLMTYHGLLDNSDPRIINTVKAIYNELRHDCLVQRYTMTDDFGKSTSAFTICSFLLVDSLMAIGEKEKAEKIFKGVIKRGNHLGLFSEDIDIKTKKLLGNFPQAYTHIGIINSAILLSEWNDRRIKIDWSKTKRTSWF